MRFGMSSVLQASYMRWKAGRRAGWMLVFGLVMASAPASADPVTWTFTDVYIDNQESVQGSFVFDTDTLTVSNFNFTVYAGYWIGTAFSYDPGDASVNVMWSSPSQGTVIGFNQTGAMSPAPPLAAAFDLWAPFLSDAGGVISLSGTNTAEYLNDFPQHSDIGGSGTLVAVGVPEPSFFGIIASYFGLAGAGLGLLAITRRLRRSAA
jgi:hypothetical protein